jgi:hypothetical protein
MGTEKARRAAVTLPGSCTVRSAPLRYLGVELPPGVDVPDGVPLELDPEVPEPAAPCVPLVGFVDVPGAAGFFGVLLVPFIPLVLLVPFVPWVPVAFVPPMVAGD